MLTLVVGGFFGDEGKGKVAAYISLYGKYGYVARTGAVNAGHTVVFRGKRYKLRCISSGFINGGTRLLTPPGALIRLDVFFSELGSSAWRIGYSLTTGPALSRTSTLSGSGPTRF